MRVRASAIVLVLTLLLVSVPGAAASSPQNLDAVSRPIPSGVPTGAVSPSVAVSAWTPRGTQPPPRDGHGFVYDSKADLFILFGGLISTNSATNSTWTYDYGTNSWTNVSPVVSPSPRVGFGMVYDSRADRVILFGGTTSPAVFSNETWIFDPANDTWTQRFPSLPPSARIIPGMAYDAGADRTILYGGNALSGLPADTWAYDYEANTWTQLSASGPGGLYLSAMTYDPAAGRDLLFGGVSSAGSTLTWHFETWEFDYANLTWTDRNPVSHPSARGGHAFSFDTVADRAILFGGTDSLGGPGPGAVYNDTWAYDSGLNAWSNVTPFVGPSARLLARMAYSPLANRTVLFGGATLSGTPHDDAWSYAFGQPLPTAPRNLQAAAGTAQVALTWQAPASDGGSPVTNYAIYRGTASGAETLLTTIGATPTYMDSAVTPGQAYYYQVAAVTAVGEGPRSNEASATPLAPPTPPSAPQNLAATPGDTHVTLTWQAPASNGGSAITGYNVYRGTSSGGEALLVSLGTVLTYTDTAVSNGVAYYYEVSAHNGAGEGPASSEVSATPGAPPTAPQSVVATAGNAQVALTWQAPASDGGSPITGYKVYASTTSGGETLRASLGNVLTFTDTGLTNGVTYYYEVSAVNGVGEGANSSEAHATPAAPADTTPPTIAITSPANHSALTSMSVTVTGTASDNVAVQKVELSLDGTTWAQASGAGSWSGTLTLVPGTNTIYARATDTSGNARTVQITVTVTVQSSGPPPSGLDPVLLAGILIVIVVAVLAVALLLWRRRKKPLAPPPGGTS